MLLINTLLCSTLGTITIWDTYTKVLRYPVCLAGHHPIEKENGASWGGFFVLGVTPRDRCARCLPVIRCCCLVILLCVASCHVIIRIASSCFRNLHPSGFPQFSPLSVLSPDTLARARGIFEVIFYKLLENVLRMG